MREKKTYRSKLRILVDMLRAIQAAAEDGVGPTKILYAANLSHDRLMQYINELLEKQMIIEIEDEENSRVYRLREERSF